MDCNLKTDLNLELKPILEALERFDAFFRDKYTLINLNPPEAFMIAWNRVKSAKQQLLSINLEDDS